MNNIHPTAVVHPNCHLGQNNYIGPFCFIGPGVVVGSNNRFEAYVCVGTPPEHRDAINRFGRVDIGDGNVLREFVTVQSGVHRPTAIADECTILRHAHISHDTQVENMVTVSCDVLIGGEGYVMQGANLGLGCVIHQRQVIGAYSMVGMNSTVTKRCKILPGRKYAGIPVRDLGRNQVALDRFNVSDAMLEGLTEAYRMHKALL